MRKKVHKPPSKIKYDQAHPTVSIRVTKELYDNLNYLREYGGKSLGDILREAVGKQKETTDVAYQTGYDVAKKEYAVVFKCSVCGGDLTISGDKAKTSAAQYMKEHKWGHVSCHEKKKNGPTKE